MATRGSRSWCRELPASTSHRNPHASNASELYVGFPYNQITLLITQWDCAIRLALRESSQAGRLSIEQLLTGWDGILFVTSETEPRDFRELLTGALSIRIGLVAEASATPGQIAAQLARLAAAAHRLPPVHTSINPMMETKLMLIRDDWRGVIYAAMRDPKSWTVKRMAATCLTNRRTLEKEFAALELPGPGALLKQSRSVELPHPHSPIGSAHPD